jgi:hypothetical protein
MDNWVAGVYWRDVVMGEVSLYSAGCFLSSQTRCRVLTAAYDVGIRRAAIDEVDLSDLRQARIWVKTAMLGRDLNVLLRWRPLRYIHVVYLKLASRTHR